MQALSTPVDAPSGIRSDAQPRSMLVGRSEAWLVCVDMCCEEAHFLR